jgi:hypothetical protein
MMIRSLELRAFVLTRMDEQTKRLPTFTSPPLYIHFIFIPAAQVTLLSNLAMYPGKRQQEYLEVNDTQS